MGEGGNKILKVFMGTFQPYDHLDAQRIWSVQRLSMWICEDSTIVDLLMAWVSYVQEPKHLELSQKSPVNDGISSDFKYDFWATLLTWLKLAPFATSLGLGLTT